MRDRCPVKLKLIILRRLNDDSWAIWRKKREGKGKEKRMELVMTNQYLKNNTKGERVEER